MQVVKRAWKRLHILLNPLLSPYAVLFCLHQVGGRRERVEGDANQSELLQKSPFQMGSVGPAAFFSFHLQDTTSTILTARKCGFFLEVFWPSSPRSFCLFVSELPRWPAPFSPCVSLRDKAGNALCPIEFNSL